MSWSTMDVDLVPQIRRDTGVSVETLSDLRINRLLRGGNDDLAATTAAVKKHIELSKRFSTDHHTASPAAEAVLLSERFQYLGVNKDQLPVISLNWMCYTPGDVDALLEAYVVFLRRTSAQVKMELGFPQMEPQFLSISVGPPPKDFKEKWMELGAAHFPEHIQKGVLYSLTAESAASCGFQDTGSVLEMVSTPAELMRSVKVAPGFIPNEILHMGSPSTDASERSGSISGSTSDDEFQRQGTSDSAWTVDASPKSTRSRSDTLQSDTFPEDQFTIRVKNTFIHVAKSMADQDCESPGRRRRHSFSGVSQSERSVSQTDPSKLKSVALRPHANSCPLTDVNHSLSFISTCKFEDQAENGVKDYWFTPDKSPVNMQLPMTFCMYQAPTEDLLDPWMMAEQYRVTASQLEATARFARAQAQNMKSSSGNLENRSKATKKAKAKQGAASRQDQAAKKTTQDASAQVPHAWVHMDEDQAWAHQLALSKLALARSLGSGSVACN